MRIHANPKRRRTSPSGATTSFASVHTAPHRTAIRLILRGPCVQAKLAVSRPNDKYEQEADRIADEVTRMREPRVQRIGICSECEEDRDEFVQTKPVADQITPLVQRQIEPQEEEEEEILQTKSVADQIIPLVQRQVESEKEEEEEEPIQTKAASGRTSVVPPAVRAQVSAMRGRGQPLPKSERAFFEPRFGHDFSNVRIHTGSRAAKVARSAHARAFTAGRDIVFGSGQYAPGSRTGRSLLAHEMTHVVQQQASPPMIQPWVSCGTPETCGMRAPGERQRARAASLQVSNLPAPDMGILISGFDIGYSNVSTLPSAPGFATFWGHLVTQPHRYEILGFTDCEGSPATNTLLRWMRAMRVNNELPSLARAKVDRFVAAPLSDCVASNAAEEGRRMNRSVAIRLTTTVHTMPGGTVTALSCPPRSTAGVTTLSDYVSLIMCAETRTGYTPRNMLAMLRQLYYGKPWSATSTTSRWDNVIPCSPNLGNPSARLGTNLYEALRNSAEVQGVDVGHVFTGLEAMTCPSPTVSFYAGLATVRMPSEEFATWGGDLGAASAAHVACGELGARAASEKDCDFTAAPQPLTFYRDYHAPPQDLEGDIDPFVMRANQLGIPCTGSTGRPFMPTRPISEIFYEYYLDPTTALGRARTNRYHCFLQALGATITNRRITNRSAILGPITNRVADFAYAFYRKIRGVLPGPSAGAMIRMQISARRVVNWFLTYLQGRL